MNTKSNKQQSALKNITNIKVPLNMVKSFLLDKNDLKRQQINLQPLIEKIKDHQNYELKLKVKRYNLHISITDLKTNQNGVSSVVFETDQEGYKQTRNNIWKLILKYYDGFNFNDKQVLLECAKILSAILYAIPVVFRGKPFRLIALIILFLSYRKYNLPITFIMIKKASKLRKARQLNTCLKTIKRLLPELKSYTQKPINFLKDIAKKLKLNQTTQELAFRILQFCQDQDIYQQGHPNTVAACIISIAIQQTGENIPIEEVAEKANCAPNTIRNIFYRIYPFIKKEFTDLTYIVS